MNTVENTADASALKTETGEAYDIPEGGSLGLLALGYIGVMLWREKKASILNSATNTNEPLNS